MNHLINRKSATLTALAAACSIMFALPAVAATNANTVASTPTAVDSSKRVIRAAKPKTDDDIGIAVAVDNEAVDMSNSDAYNNVATAPVNTTPPVAQYQQPAQVKNQTAAVPAPSTPAYPNSANRSVGNSRGQLANIPLPSVQLSDVSFLPTVLINQDTRGSNKIDVSLLDAFITDVSPHARHYPPNFPNRTQGYNARENIKMFVKWIEPYASAPNASYDVLIRAAKLNAMGRNLDLGTEYAVRGGAYVDRAIKSDPKSGEANFIYGMMLAEGGGFKEGQKYLDRAVALGYSEAEQSLAQSDLLSDRRSQALERLRRLERQYPNNSIISQQIKLVEDGKFYIWDLPAPNVNIKAIM